jgi:hypothetical protein
MKEIEILREKFSVEWNDFQTSSGAIVLVNPTIKSCLVGFFFLFACEMREQDLRTVTLEISPLKIIFEHDYMVTKDAKAIMNKIDNFFKFASNLTEETLNLYNKFSPQYEQAKLKIEEYKTDHLTPEEKIKVERKLKKNSEILENANETITYIYNIITRKDSDLIDMQQELSSVEFIETLVTIERDNHKNSKSDPLYLMYTFSKEEKVKSLSEARDRVIEGKMNLQEIEKMNTVLTN